MTVSLTTEKTGNIMRLAHLAIQKKMMSIQKFAETIGTLVASLPAVKFGELYYRQCNNLKSLALKQQKGNYNAKVRLSAITYVVFIVCYEIVSYK